MKPNSLKENFICTAGLKQSAKVYCCSLCLSPILPSLQAAETILYISTVVNEDAESSQSFYMNVKEKETFNLLSGGKVKWREKSLLLRNAMNAWAQAAGGEDLTLCSS